jgi:thioredoxin 1
MRPELRSGPSHIKEHSKNHDSDEEIMMSALITLSDTDFEQQVLQSKLPVVVDFGAPWCPPCRAIAPILAELAGEYAGQLTIATVNIDEEQRWAQTFDVTGLPTLIVFKEGKEVQRVRGAAPKRVLKEVFDSVLTVADAAVP